MLKTLSIYSINFYQAAISPSLKVILGTGGVCRFDETCSTYTKRMVQERGAVKGIGIGFVRLLKCQPITS